MFFDNDLIELMVQETNLYYKQTKGTPLNVTTDEIKDFIAIHLLMGIVKLPAYIDYWSKKLRYNKIADIMPLKRFQQIRRYLHFVNNLQDDGDRYYKVRQLLESVRRNCLKIEEEIRFSIDKMMVPYKGTRAGYRKQYIQNKPLNGALNFLFEQEYQVLFMTIWCTVARILFVTISLLKKKTVWA